MSWLFWLYVAAVAAFWLGVARDTRRRQQRGEWRLGLDGAVLPELPELRVIIPARDEARNIEGCLRAVGAAGHPRLRVTVFDDGSTDGTGEIARRVGAEIGLELEVQRGGGEPLPEGWRGKTWALQRAAQARREGWLLFLDADVRMAPGSLAILHSYAVRERTAFLSGFGRLTMESFWERVIQPIMGGIILSGNPLERVNDDQEQEKVIANGQLILVEREAYEALGQHRAVAGDILEDVGLARHFRKEGRKMRALLTRDLFACRMYTSLEEIWLGWTKNFYVGLRKKPLIAAGLAAFLLLYNVVPWAVGVWGVASVGMAWAAGIAAPVAAWGGIGLLAVVQGVRFYLDRALGQEARYGLLQPLGSLMVIGIVLDSMRRVRLGRLVWKGRVYGA